MELNLTLLPRVPATVPATILVADDHLSNRTLFEEMLSREGFAVTCAVDGVAALQQFKLSKPDLVLLDVMMPRMNGFEVCRAIKNNPETRLLPVILVTALSALEDRVRGIECGADDFLTRPVDRVQLLARVRSLLKLKSHSDELEKTEAVLFALARSIEAKGPRRYGHCEQLAELSAQLGESLGVSPEHVAALRRAAIVHDIGNVAIPESILLKPAPLVDEEWNIVREHPLIGERFCAALQSFRLVLPIIRHHHEKCDGSGYPDGICRHEIPETARILQIVDVYDALTSERPYRRAFSPNDALAIMDKETREGWWDPEMFARFKYLVADWSGQSGSRLRVTRGRQRTAHRLARKAAFPPTTHNSGTY